MPQIFPDTNTKLPREAGNVATESQTFLADNRSLISVEELEYRNRYTGDLAGKAAVLEAALEAIHTDNSGQAEGIIFSILHNCSWPPRDDVAFQEFVSSLQARGESNGKVLETQEKWKKRRESSLEVWKILPDSNPADWLTVSAEKGSTVSMVNLVLHRPADYQSWTEEKKRDHRLEMGMLLEQARSLCEPKAFEVFGAYRQEHSRWINFSLNDQENTVVERSASA